MKSTPVLPLSKTGHTDFNESFGHVPFAFFVHATKTTEPILTHIPWSLTLGVAILKHNRIKAQKSMHFLAFLFPAPLFSAGRTSIQKSPGQLQLRIMQCNSVLPGAINNVHPRGERKISICIYSRVHYFYANNSILSSSFSLVYKQIRIISLSHI